MTVPSIGSIKRVLAGCQDASGRRCAMSSQKRSHIRILPPKSSSSDAIYSHTHQSCSEALHPRGLSRRLRDAKSHIYWHVIDVPTAVMKVDNISEYGIVLWRRLSKKWARNVMAAKLIEGKWSKPIMIPVSSSVDRIVLTGKNTGYIFTTTQKEIQCIPFKVRWQDN